ncbi:MAG: hypothetical protein P0Y53_01500 [Candidatus Pseudobacter hemicellulosilyticus]|uniref:Uncharacterized protein n=1 Tax=Candidatus Pseudobacter hemicellulosilyticus TaxID=3121375 RepID=A0AAJ5WV46_9BACT|nr:MAG: hypothetical protein P0Y53_01500 [Pseudobacter sp.]
MKRRKETGYYIDLTQQSLIRVYEPDQEPVIVQLDQPQLADLITKLQESFQRADWFYYYSEDPLVFLDGLRQVAAIDNDLKQLIGQEKGGLQMAAELWNNHHPYRKLPWPETMKRHLEFQISIQTMYDQPKTAINWQIIPDLGDVYHALKTGHSEGKDSFVIQKEYRPNRQDRIKCFMDYQEAKAHALTRSLLDNPHLVFKTATAVREIQHYTQSLLQKLDNQRVVQPERKRARKPKQ